MTSYTGIKPSSLVSVGSASPVKLFTANARGRAGYRIYNGSAVDLLIIEVPKGSAAPAAGAFSSGDLDYRIPSQKTQDSGAEDTIDVYGLLASGGASNIAIRELFNRRDTPR